MAATSGIQREIFARYGVQSRVICEVSNLSTPATQYAERTPGEALRIAWLGRHLPGKALNLLLAALARVPASVDWRLDICGDGPCQMGWRRLADKLGLAGRCTWHGQVSRDAALRVLKSAHLFVTTSLKDLTSTVVVEALASGVPVLCPDHCGFSDAITSECGIKIPLGSIDKFISNLAHKIVLVEVNEPWRRRLAAGALRRARDFSLERKAQLIEEVYTAAIARRPMTYASGALADPELVGNAFSSSTVGGGAVGDIRLE